MSISDVILIRDRRSCERAIRYGGIAAMLTAGVNATFAALSLSNAPVDEKLAAHLNPWLILDAALVLVLGIFVFRKSRVAATVLFFYFVVVKALDARELLHASPLLVVLFAFLVLYLNAMRATYVWHASYKQ